MCFLPLRLRDTHTHRITLAHVRTCTCPSTRRLGLPYLHARKHPDSLKSTLSQLPSFRAPHLGPDPLQAFFFLILTPSFRCRVLSCCCSTSCIFYAPTRLLVGMKDQLPCLHPGPSVMGHTAQRGFLKFKSEPMLPVQQPPMAACPLTQCGRTTLPHSFASQPPARATATGPEGNQREIPLPLLGAGKRQGVSPSAHILTSCPRFLFYRIGTPSTPRQGLLKEAAQLF